MKLFKLILISIFIPLSSNAGDFPEKIDQLLKHFETEYISENETKQFNKILDSSNTIFQKHVLLKRKYSFKNSYDQTVYPRLHLSFYWYSDSLEGFNSFRNQLNCLYPDCSKLKIDEDMRGLKSIPTFIYYGLGRIITLRTNCEHLNSDYKKTKELIIKILKLELISFVDIGCGGPVVWNKFINN